jgi:hypothetical protein
VVLQMSAIKSNRVLGLLLVLVGSVVGVLHIWMAITSIVVFRQDEPISSWITILAGPCSTLPAAWAGGFRRRVGAIWLIGGSVVSFLFFLPGGGRYLIPFLLTVVVPMVCLGLGFFYLHRVELVPGVTERSANGDHANHRFAPPSPTTPSRGGRR